jgi:NAD(P)H-hydrate epimerase
MFGRHSSAVSRWETQKEMSLKYGIILVLKGAHTSISMPDGTCFFNATGNPGMAKAGSGDVLTGIITGLLARGYSPVFSSLFGVWLHGAAGDHLAAQYGLESNFSGELIDALREVLLQQYQEVFNT